ncbi:antibiotic biosynthesis monooxygenase [Paraglaciecola aquimarina]|uniref:Antibiotic biosynthesis monooxygenase n=1 Tax=Paraglaciecola algarum TaxID=3050085 RepID=A0ABS9D549_9ALTE|nr:putative quinol monooxygenase [Paraglaciecola sp. G1-23]MCF2948006.1 antibiotic biosynthesis monooxygenase [Paraglaciecola sp. G1-23]
MPHLTIVANITAKADKVELVKNELLKLVQPSLKDAGCINYVLHQDNVNPTLFMFYENWQTRELWQEHMNTSHVKALNEATEGAIEHVSLQEMTGIE